MRDLVVVACSAGGLDPLRQLVRGLPTPFDAALLVVQHIPASGGRLASILGREVGLPVGNANHGEPVRPGHIYVAPADRHMVVHDTEIWLVDGPKINRVRPAADALFRSAARWYGPRTVAVVLSGVLDDGAAGAAAIAGRGGVTLVQSPAEAAYGGMPQAALAASPGAWSVPTDRLAKAVTELVGQPVTAPAGPLPKDLLWETDMTEAGMHPGRAGTAPGVPVAIACPECHGGMNRVQTGAAAVHYRCHVGHSYSPQTLLSAQAEQTEAALWQAVAILEEQATVHREIAQRCAARGRHREQRAHLEAARQAGEAARVVRERIPGASADRAEVTT